MSQYLKTLQKELYNNTFLPNDCIKLICDIVNDKNEPLQFVANCKEILKQYDPLLQRIIKEYPRSQSLSQYCINNIITFGQLTILQVTLGYSFDELFHKYDNPLRNEIQYIFEPKLSTRKLIFAVNNDTSDLMYKYAKQLYREIITPLITVVKKKYKNYPGYKTLINFDPEGEDGYFIRNIINSDIQKNIIMRIILTGIYGEYIIEKFYY